MKKYRTRNGAVVEVGEGIVNARVVSKGFGECEQGKVLYLVRGDVKNPLTWEGQAYGDGYDIVSKYTPFLDRITAAIKRLVHK